MDDYEEGVKLLEEKFGGGKDVVIALATVARELGAEGRPRPAVRCVDAYYEDRVFYVTSHSSSNKMREIAENPEVSVAGCSEMFTASAIGENLGWVMDPKNEALRAKLRAAFAPWYESANDERDEGCCILAIRLTEGILNVNHWEKLYRLDFMNRKALLTEGKS